MFHGLLSRDREDGTAIGKPQGVGPEAYLNGTAQGTTPEDGHIIRARCAPLSPASGFPVSWSQQVIYEISRLGIDRSNLMTSGDAASLFARLA